MDCSRGQLANWEISQCMAERLVVRTSTLSSAAPWRSAMTSLSRDSMTSSAVDFSCELLSVLIDGIVVISCSCWWCWSCCWLLLRRLTPNISWICDCSVTIWLTQQVTHFVTFITSFIYLCNFLDITINTGRVVWCYITFLLFKRHVEQMKNAVSWNNNGHAVGNNRFLYRYSMIEGSVKRQSGGGTFWVITEWVDKWRTLMTVFSSLGVPGRLRMTSSASAVAPSALRALCWESNFLKPIIRRPVSGVHVIRKCRWILK